MKKYLFIMILSLLVLSHNTNIAQAAVFNFYPTPNDLGDLAHAYYYTWGINWTLPQGQIITGATLTFKNIYDWTTEANDHLYTHLLDNPMNGVTTGTDNEGGGDNFVGQGTLVGNWSDPNGGSATGFNLVYNFGTLGLLDELTAYTNTPGDSTHANFGFGIDPDCHYYNDKVKFQITTCRVTTPEPASMTLLGLGLLGIWKFGKRK